MNEYIAGEKSWASKFGSELAHYTDLQERMFKDMRNIWARHFCGICLSCWTGSNECTYILHYRSCLQLCLQSGKWVSANQLVHFARHFAKGVDSVLHDILLDAVRLEKWTVVQRLSMMYLATRLQREEDLKTVITDQWTRVSSLIHAYLPSQVVEHLVTSCSKHELIMLFVVELCHCPKIINETVSALQLLFHQLLATDPIQFDMILKIISEADCQDTAAPGGYLEVHNLFRYSRKRLLTMRSEHLDELISRLDKDKNEACVFFAVLLSVHRNQWNYVTKAIKDRHLLIKSGAMEILFLSLEARAWKCAAVLLESLVRADLQSSRALEGTLHLVFKYYFQLCANRKQIIRSFFKVCRNERLPRAGAMMAIWNRKMTALEKFMTQPMDNQSVARLVDMLLPYRLGGVPCLLFLRIIQVHQYPDVKHNVLKFAALEWLSSQSQGYIRMVVELMDGAEEPLTVSMVLDGIVHGGQVHMLRLLLTKGHLKFVDDRMPFHQYLLQIVIQSVAETRKQSGFVCFIQGKEGQRKGYYKDEPRECRKAREMLSLCVEAGFTSQPFPVVRGPTPRCTFVTYPLWLAASSGLVDVVDVLYKTGACTNRELSAIQSCSSFRVGMERLGRADVLTYFDNAASNVRSLQTLCAVQVSRCIGCQPDRKHRALQLPLSMHVIEKVLFYDVLHPN